LRSASESGALFAMHVRARKRKIGSNTVRIG
jgi:hypothetical protein